MRTSILPVLGLLALTACSTKPGGQAAAGDSLSRNLELAPADTSQPLNDRADNRTARSAEPRAATGSAVLPAGTIIRASMRESINSRHDQAGKTVTARVAADVTDTRGQVVIPAGSVLDLTVTELRPATSKSQADGRLALRVNSITTDGRVYPVSAEVRSLRHQLRGRGVTAGEAEKVGAGTAIGAVLGRVIGGNSKGAIIGGVVGAAGGTAVAVQTASRDVVVPVGTPVTVVLTGQLAVGTS